MNMNNLTIKTQEAITQAQMIALGNQQQKIDNLHLLKAIFEIDENVIPYIIKKQGANPNAIAQEVERRMKSIPKVTGGDPYLSSGVNTAIQQAMLLSQQMGDEFISLEHLFFGIFKANDDASKILKDNGLTEKGIQTSIQELRKGSKATSSTSEDTYNALNKFATNITITYNCTSIIGIA